MKQESNIADVFLDNTTSARFVRLEPLSFIGTNAKRYTNFDIFGCPDADQHIPRYISAGKTYKIIRVRQDVLYSMKN